MKSHRVFTRLFGKPEEINGAGRCPTYLYRWIVFGKKPPCTCMASHDRGYSLCPLNKRKEPPFKVYLHHFVADDWSLDLHDHPKRFISIGLKGGYVEWTPCLNDNCRTIPCDFQNQKVFNAPWLRSFPAEHVHRLSMFRTHPTGEAKPCWTLVIVLRGTREWGFWHLGRFIHWKTYIKSETADEMKACGGL